MAAPRGVVRLVAAGGPGIGMGHLARSTALACALRLRGYSVNTRGVGLGASFELDGIEWSIEQFVADEEPVMTILDGYELGSENLTVQGPIVLMHPLRGEGVEPSAFLDVGGTGDGGLRGLEYACLRRPFWSCGDRRLADEVGSALVTSGASDAGGGVAALAARVKAALPQASVTAVRGPFSHTAAPEGVELLDAPRDLAPAMAASDLVVSAAGLTMLEALSTAAPTIGLIVAENQRAQAESVRRVGAAEVCEPRALEAALDAVAGDRGRRAELARGARNAVDGLGAHRAGAALLEAVGERGPGQPWLGGVELRTARPTDSAMLLALRNDPVVRRFSRSTQEVSGEEHTAWLDRSLADPGRALMIVEADGGRIGQLRLDSRGSSAWELSVSLLARSRGSGLGGAAVRSGVAYALVELRAGAVVAWINDENEASKRAFRAVGFTEAGEERAGFAAYRCTRAGFRWE